MIYTCTLNPSVDYILHVDVFEQGGLNRGKKTFYYPGGKGINVSRVLTRLGVANMALGFLGGFTGEFIKKELEKEDISHAFTEIDDTTRINMKLKSKEETEINGPGPVISSDQQQLLLNQVKKMQKDDYLIAAGSIPASISADFYSLIADLCEQQGVHLVVDTSSKALKDIIGRSLFLVKPNHHELAELVGEEITTIDAAATYAKQLNQQGAENVIVSMGGQGAVFVSETEQLYAEVPAGKVINTVGSGDSMVAGFMAAYQSTGSKSAAFKQAVAAGSATAFSADLCEREDVETLLSAITIHQLEKESS